MDVRCWRGQSRQGLHNLRLMGIWQSLPPPHWFRGTTMPWVLLVFPENVHRFHFWMLTVQRLFLPRLAKQVSDSAVHSKPGLLVYLYAIPTPSSTLYYKCAELPGCCSFIREHCLPRFSVYLSCLHSAAALITSTPEAILAVPKDK